MSSPVGGPSAPMYHASVTMDNSNSRAFLLLHSDRLALITLRLDQADRVRNYSWPYTLVKKIVRLDANELGRHKLYIYFDNNNQLQDDTIEMDFANRLERDMFDFRIKILARIYSQKTVPVPKQKAHQSVSGDLQADLLNADLKLAQKQEEAERCSSPEFDMFSPENLRRLALAEHSSPTLAPSGPSPKRTPPKPDAQASLPTGGLSTTTTRQPWAERNSNGQVAEPGKFVIPLEISSSELDFQLAASARLSLRLHLDLEALTEAYKVEDRAERLRKIRQLVQLDSPLCELSFS